MEKAKEIIERKAMPQTLGVGTKTEQRKHENHVHGKSVDQRQSQEAL